ncbi:MAG TPA: hypothetical protein DCR28_00785 [Eubacterium sp.]|nr:hypothetical protein [Eubacterium sp.]
MRGFTKKIASVVLALTLVIGLATSASAAVWDGYFGANDGSFWEGATGTMGTNTAKAFTARMTSVGWGGVWGCQVKRPYSFVKGKTYVLSFNAKSTKANKYIYVKMAKGLKNAPYTTTNFAKGFWVKLPKGKTVKVNEVFKAADLGDMISFGLGGEAGDRDGSDEDAAVRYGIFEKQFKLKRNQLGTLDCDGDFSSVTDISVTDFSLTTAATKVKFSAKAKGKKKVKVTLKKAAGIKTFEIKVGKVKKKTTKTKITIKAKKKGKQKVQVRGISADKAYKTKWASKKVKVK